MQPLQHFPPAKTIGGFYAYHQHAPAENRHGINGHCCGNSLVPEYLGTNAVVHALDRDSGFILMMWSWGLFKQQHLAICLPAKTVHITKAGPYRFSRNPMYLGMILMLLGLALYVGTLPFYLSAIGYFAILNFFFCPYEENKLANAFGNEYREYKNRVRRWV